MKLLPNLLCAFVALLVCAPAVTTQDKAKPLTPSSLEKEIDLSLRWLRGQQDEKTGGYGDVGATTAVLMAFGDSHRKYRAGDGPYIQRAIDFLVLAQGDDGSFTGGDLPADEVRAMTMAAYLALEKVGGESSVEARKKAALFLGLEPGKGIATRPTLTDVSTDELLDRAGAELANRHPLGFWEEKGERVHTTAGTVWRLSALCAELKSRAGANPASAAEKPLPVFDPADRTKAIQSVLRGAEFLVSAAESGKWGFQGKPDAGITAMVTAALCAVPEPRPEHIQRTIDGALDWLVSLQKEDGSIHTGTLHNYVTCAAVMALSAGGREQDAAVLKKARAWLRILQADEGEGYAKGHRYYGGVGYGGDERPDLSNLQMALEALATGDEEENKKTFEKALVFLQRCQNRSESNDVGEVLGTDVKSGDDGGSGYAPGESKAGFVELGDGTKVPRSYGSMTYALLKGYLFAGLPKDDPRVAAAWKWLMRNYSLDVNPGFEAASDPAAAYQGLFYYFHTMAKALDLYGEERVVDARGGEHLWRAELSGRLVSLQRKDGSWINENSPRWYEGNPVLATAYALSSLGIALP